MLQLVAHIETSLDADLSLDALAAVAGLSKFHLQRTFRAAIGETPRAFVERARLERAAFHLLVRQAPLLDIALDCGFASHEVFVRAFRRCYRVPPSRWRATTLATRTPRAHQPLAEGRLSATKLQQQRPLTIAFVRHTGPYEDVPMTMWSELARWARSRDIKSGALLGVGHDAPGLVPAARLRFDACMVVPDDTVVRAASRIAVRTLPETLLAITTYVGPLAALGRAYGEVMGRLLVRKDVEVIGLPVIERYRGTELLDGKLELIEMCIPVRPCL